MDRSFGAARLANCAVKSGPGRTRAEGQVEKENVDKPCASEEDEEKDAKYEDERKKEGGREGGKKRLTLICLFKCPNQAKKKGEECDTSNG